MPLGTNGPNTWEVAVLALLRERSMHPYEMQCVLKERHKDEILVLKRGSLYHAIDRLLQLGFIEATSTGRAGNRPQRTIYSLTSAGQAQFRKWLDEMLTMPVLESSQFRAALSFLVHLTPKQALTNLERRAQHLETQLRSLADEMAQAQSRVGRINLIESDYLAAMRTAELQWIRRLLNELRHGTFNWNLRKILREAKGGEI